MKEYESMDIHSEPGTKVVFMGRGGYDREEKDAREKLVIGQTYTVKSTVVHNWSTDVYLEEVGGVFNSVQFSKAED